jgi:predicted ATP-dependent endonuclease of OLD family
MKPTGFRVENYKCIEDTGWIELEDLTCFIGKNQSGKTAFLNAIEKLNAEQGSSQYEPFKEYPRERYSEYELRHEENPDDVVHAKFQISDEIIRQIENEIGKGVIKDKIVVVTKNYKNDLYWDLEIDEGKYIEYLIEDFDLPNKTEDMLKDSNSIEE